MKELKIVVEIQTVVEIKGDKGMLVIRKVTKTSRKMTGAANVSSAACLSLQC